MSKSLSLRAKSILGVSVISLVLGLVAASAIYAVTTLKARITVMTEETVPAIDRMGNLRYHITEAARLAFRTGMVAQDAKEVDRLYKKFLDEKASYHEEDVAFKKLVDDPKLLKYFETQEEKAEEFFKVTEEAFTIMKEKGDEKRLDHLMAKEIASMKVAFNKAAAETLKVQEAQNKEDEAIALAQAQRAINALLGTAIVGFLFTVIGGLVFAGWLTRTLSEISVKLESGSESVSGASKKIADSAMTLSQSTQEQASALQETAASLHEITAMVERSSTSAAQSAQLAEQSSAAVESGKHVISELEAAMDAIASANNDIGAALDENNRKVSDIVKVISEIGDKTKVINDIVFQTKLLSFNASVEAARAGEHGKGFAVVAEEVGNLANSSGRAAKEIADLLESSISSVRQVVSQTAEQTKRITAVSQEKVRKGSDVSKQCLEVFEGISGKVGDMVHRIQEISSATSEQALGVAEISKAMNLLDQATQANSAQAVSAESSSHELSGQADGLHQAVLDLTRIIQGGMKSELHVVPHYNVASSPRVEDAAEIKRAA